MSRSARFVIVVMAAFAFAVPCWAASYVVAVGNFFFNPANLTVNQGDTVIWVNGQGTHNVHHTATPALFDTLIAPAPWVYHFVFNVPAGTYNYICQAHPANMLGAVTVQISQDAPVPPSVVPAVELEQNYPNPFNSRTAIRFSMPFATDAKLSVLNVLGQPVMQLVNGPVTAGTHEILFDADKLATGMYYYRLETPLGTLARKMYLLR